jgi:hypothetical protein
MCRRCHSANTCKRYSFESPLPQLMIMMTMLLLLQLLLLPLLLLPL